MKKKILSLLLCCMMAIGTLTGCNLFERDNQAYLTQIVAEIGDIKITKEEFINGYYNYGNTLIQNGSSQNEAVEETLEMLLQRGLLLKYVKSLAAKETTQNIEQQNYLYQLTNKEYNDAVKESWDYIDEQIKELALKIVPDIDDVFTNEEEREPDFDPETKFEPTIELEYVNEEWKIKRKVGDFENDESKLDVLDYQKPDFVSEVVMNKVWSQYIQSLRDTDAERGNTGKTEQQLLDAELKRVFEINLDNAYLTKFQESYENNYGYDKDGYLTTTNVQKILDKYISIYNANVEEYNLTPDSYYDNVTSTENRKNYLYYGSGERILEVQHILIKFDSDAISEIENDPYLTPAEKQSQIDYLKSPDGVVATLRDDKGYNTDTTMSVQELYDNIIMQLVKTADTIYTRGTEQYANYMAQEFNKLVYTYNQDEGIINSQFDYTIGSTSHSAMVDSFTDATRALYDNGNGYLGSVSGLVESEYGYHIIILNNVLTNIEPNTVDIKTLYDTKTSRSSVAEDNMLEYLLSQVLNGEYSSFENRVINTLKSGLTFKFYKSRYKDYLA